MSEDLNCEEEIRRRREQVPKRLRGKYGQAVAGKSLLC